MKKLILPLTCLLGFSTHAFAQQAPPKPDSPAKMRPVLEKLEVACLKSREAFVKKYTAVEESPAKTCACVKAAFAAQAEVAAAQDGIGYFEGTKHFDHAIQEEELTEEYVEKVESNCRVDPNWKQGTYEPENFEERMHAIQELMKVRHKKEKPKAKKPKGP